MASDGETVRLVTDMLDQMQCRRVSGDPIEVAGHGINQLFHTRAPGDTLGNTNQRNVRNTKFIKHFPGNVQLALTTVDEHQVRAFALTCHHAFISARQNLAHGSIVITAGNTLDIVKQVVAFQRPILVENHAGCDRVFTMAMTDVKALHT